jgi:pimeloyl-ACP methyl ester carboxylesterase
MLLRKPPAADPPATWVHEDERAVPVPMWREPRVIAEWLALRASPTVRGGGVTPGNGSGVILVPGFGLSDWYLFELRRWLRRLGYRAFPSHIGQAADCLDVLTERLLNTVERVVTETGRPVHLVGHSLGGVLARSVAARRPERVASVVTLASPFRGLRAHPMVLRSWRLTRRALHHARTVPSACFSFACPCEAVRALHAPVPPTVVQRAVYSRTDGVVDWRYCVTGDAAVDVPVAASHIGMVVNHGSYRAIAEALASAHHTAASIDRAG